VYLDTMQPMFAPFCKVDAEQRMVYGYASTEKRDQQGEVITRNAIERALPDYMKFANIREMHQPSAVGTAQEAHMDANGLYIGAKVVDDRAWAKVKSGVYKGFSVGGKVQARDPDDRSIITALELSEISLVDRPANPEAVFEIVKRDRSTASLQMQPFQKWDCGLADHQHTTKSEAATCMAHELIKLAQSEGDVDFFAKKKYTDKQRKEMANSGEAKSDGSFPIKDKADLENAIHDWGRAGSTESDKKHIIARAKALGASDMLPADWEGSTKNTEKRAPHLSTGRFGTHSAAAEEHHKRSADHKNEAVKARKQEAKHRANSLKARDRGDAQGVSIHEHLAGAAASLATAHDESADKYRLLAEGHEAAAKTQQEHSMSKTVIPDDDKTTKAISNLETALGSAVKIDYAAEAEDARKSAFGYFDEIAALDAAAKAARAVFTKAKADKKKEEADQAEDDAEGQEKMAGITSEVADAAAKLYALSLSSHAGQDGADHSVIASLADAAFQRVSAFAAAHEGAAKGHDDAEKAAGADKDLAAHHHNLAITRRAGAEGALALAKQFEGVRDEHVKAGGSIAKSDDMEAAAKKKKEEEAAKVAATMPCPACKAEMPKDCEKCQSCGAMMKVVKAAVDPKARKAAKLAKLGSVGKGMSIIASLCYMLEQIESLATNSEVEQVLEGDADDPTPGKLRELCSQLAALLVGAVAQETEEMLEGEDVDASTVEMAAKAGSLAAVLKRAAEAQGTSEASKAAFLARAASFEKIATAHAAKAAAEAETAQKKAKEEEEARKAASGSDIAKVIEQNASLAKQNERMITVIENVTRDIQRLTKRDKDRAEEAVLLRKEITGLKAEPAPARARVMVTALSKAADLGNTENQGETFQERINKIDDPRERSAAIMKHAMGGGKTNIK
jgi:HK97 family phage prohead protease